MPFTYIEHTIGVNKMIERIDENGNSSWIPCDESNRDYQEYLNPKQNEGMK